MSTKLSVPPHSTPDEQTISTAAELELLDKHGNNVKFAEIFQSQKAIVVFVRHFFCGSCQSYVQALASVPQEALAASDARIIVIGCGEAQPIEMYAKMTGLSDDNIYANPSRSVYYALGMDAGNTLTTPPGVERRSYMPKNDFINATSSIFVSLIRRC
ncbi:hypothetical protein D9619_002366 [Psilocybe cf. subviscida]|uniref:Thioredoxin domain-containing protein n=1 Tax=Psilocybe cf. subviscida TaxID=2480587 RepID=A0A8H5EUY7_9AGAR|nr:hypothetical protein D9619_002366 [Psilocybe cf. subviscida]